MLVSEFTSNEFDAPPPSDARLFGIEVEYEQCMMEEELYAGWRDHWSYTSDGSLRDGGCEFISRPLPLVEAARAFYKLTQEAQMRGWVSSVRTGIHVHVDMRDLHMEQVAGVVASYAAFEPLFFDMVGEEREQCIYCVPWYLAPDQAHIVPRMVADPRRAGLGRAGAAVKYSALYLAPLRTFGTIEFRQAPTWQDPKKMRRWLCAINRVVEWGKNLSPAVVLERCESDLTPLTREIFGWTIDGITDPESLIDEADSLGTVAEMLPNTYEANDWTCNADNGATEGIGYHAQQRNYIVEEDPFPRMDLDEMVQHYDDDEPDYDDEEDSY